MDQAILSEEDRAVVMRLMLFWDMFFSRLNITFYFIQVIRFGHDWDPTCMKMDEVLYQIAEKVKNFAVIYLVDITEVPDFNKM